MPLRELTDDEKASLAPLRGPALDRRQYAIADLEVRAVDDDTEKVTFLGHAAVTGRGYDMYGGPESGGWVEYVDPGAFKKTLSEKPDVAFLVNHTGLTMARTTSGSLKLAEDKVGLATEAVLDTRRRDVNDVVIGLENGDLTEMSFAFRITKQVWLNDDGDEVPWWDLDGIERHIKEVSIHKGDVSVVNYGANPYTDAALRSLDQQVALRAALLGEEVPADPASIPMHPDLLKISLNARAF